MRFFLLLSLQAVGLAVQAQPTTQAPDTRSPWNVGLKLGLGASYRDDISGHRTQATGGLTAGYTGQVAGGVLTLQADALLERRGPRPWQATAPNTVLFVPLYVRTAATSRVHVLLGAGPSVWLSGNRVPASQSAFYTAHRVEATALAGLEVRLLPLHRAETTLSLTYRRSFTPAQEASRYSPGGHLSCDKDFYYWLGATLNVYLHPAAR